MYDNQIVFRAVPRGDQLARISRVMPRELPFQAEIGAVWDLSRPIGIFF
ncbi:MAG: hypothetical protein V4564_05635 [Pseudomonadota bacterium]